MLTAMSIMLPRAAVAAERIDEVIRTESSIEDAKNPEELREHKGVIRFSHVSFRYPGAEADVLEDIDFTAEPGKTTAIIGSTGCGKSTLVNLIPRLYDVTGGSVTLDGQDIRNIRMEDLREEIGFVPQKGVLFSGTIASNLRFGNETPQMSRSKRRQQSHRQPILLRRNRKNTTAILHRAEATFPVDRNSVLPLHVRLQNSRKSMCLMTVSLHLT